MRKFIAAIGLFAIMTVGVVGYRDAKPASAADQPGVGCSIYSAYCWYRWQVCGPWFVIYVPYPVLADRCGFAY